VTRIEDALSEAYRVLRPGGRLMVLEFSQIPNPMMQWAYDRYSFNVIPVMGQAWRGTATAISIWSNRSASSPIRRPLPHDPRAGFGQVKYRNLTMGIAACIPAGSSEVRGPHNIWRLIRTGATLERTGAMAWCWSAFERPAAPARRGAGVLGWPFKWLGLRAIPPAARHPRADRAGAGLYQVRPDPVDPPRHGGRRAGAAVARICRTSCRPSPPMSPRR
jgi:hypothetical protein